MRTPSYFATAAALLAGPAFAADMPLKAPPPPAVFSWDGCYVGGNMGWVGDRPSTTLSPTGTYLTPAGALAPPNANGTGALAGDLASVTDSLRTTGSGFAGGGQVGCNKQVGQWVFGIEGDIDGTSLRDTLSASFAPVTSANPFFTVSSHTDTVTAQVDWYSTFRTRFGYAADRWIFYVTGGFAVGDVNSSTNVTFGSNGTSPVYANAVHLGSSAAFAVGGTAGAGVEYAFTDHWSAKVEYLFIVLARPSYNSPLTAPAGVAPGYAWNTVLSEQIQTVRFGVNYRF
ncbi:MAG TPA: outer membrane beta-barrel protein [Xanthobacteraceae bacterium]|nr:outer membrane beta-barrel protein [Xanthobacteraceae bacterium]